MQVGNASSRRRPLDLLDRVFLAAAGLLAFNAVVIPNAVRLLSIPMLLLAALAAAPRVRWSVDVAALFGLTSLVTMFYTAIGVARGHPDAFVQLMFVYLVSPLLWMVVLGRAFDLLGPIRVTRVVVALGFMATLSVFAFFIAFFTIGADGLIWLIAEPNVRISEGTVGAAMHVFGSMMFFAGSCFAASKFIRHRTFRVFMLVCLVLATVLSGRSALFLAVLLGILSGLVVRFHAGALRGRDVAALAVVAVLFAASSVLLADAMEFDLGTVFSAVIEKLMEGGGDERSAQWASLVEGIQDSHALGAGHGVGVSVVRDPDYPWRYELLWVATVFRVGLVGALIYAMPAAWVVIRFAIEYVRRHGDPLPVFYLTGLLAALLGAATNPYFESFDFQWMLVLPLAYFDHQRRMSTSIGHGRGLPRPPALPVSARP
jgi:hypothetical protein